MGSCDRPSSRSGTSTGSTWAIRRSCARSSSARALVGGEAVVYTFDPHPRKVLRPDSAPALLTTLEQKIELLERCGVDAVVVEPFTLEFARTDAETFVRECLHAGSDPWRSTSATTSTSAAIARARCAC